MATPRKVAVVTGAGSGIGWHTSLALAKEGFAVILAGRTLQRLQDAAATIQSQIRGACLLAVPTDVSDPASVQQMFARTCTAFERIDLLFNNAGFMPPGLPPDKVPIDQWETVLRTNLTGAFLCARQAFGIMKQQSPRGGRIINNGSISAQVPRPNSVAYTVSKHGITGLTKSLSLDGRAFDIAVGQIDIGNAATAATERMKSGVPQANGTMAAEPLIDPGEVARAIVYMASLPLSANVQFMTVMATQMPYIGRG